MTFKDIKGKKYGKLTAKNRTKKKKSNSPVWECECDCGLKCEAPLSYLTRGNVKSCGCLRTPDLTGKKVGRLLVRDIHSRGKSILWECKCDCGNLTLATTSQLKKQSKRSCGCLEEENRKRIAGHNLIDITGQKFGKLIVLKKTNKRNKKKEILWECKCDCGNFKLSTYRYLKNRHTTSCGCVQQANKKIFGELIKKQEVREKISKTFSKNDGIERGTKLSALKRGGLLSSNKSGHTGVCYLKNSNKWKAYITLKGHQISLGEYKEKDDAIKARELGEEKYYKPIISKYEKMSKQHGK